MIKDLINQILEGIVEKNLTHLHAHTTYSLLDGYNRPFNYAKRAKELKMKAIAITDHNHLAGIVEFEDACKEYDLKPIYGLEGYYTHDMLTIMSDKNERDEIAKEKALEAGFKFEHEPEVGKNGKLKKPKKMTKKEISEVIAPFAYDTRSYHVLLLAKNQQGWENLIKIQSIAAEKGLFNARYHCDLELLRQYSDGLIITTACIGSYIAKSFERGEDDKAEDHLVELIDIFGKENVFCEIQGLDWDVQYRVNKKLIALSKRYGVGLIATNDIHYTNKEDNVEHDIVLCIGTGKKVKDENRMRYEHEFWVKSYKEMVESFIRQAEKHPEEYESYMKFVLEALDNTNKVADMIDDNIKIGADKELLPNATVPENHTPETYIKEFCYKELYKYLSKNDLLDKRLIYEKRLKEELDVINPKGFASYLLIVHEDITWSDNNGIPFGPGRGSAAGSLVAFLLKIVKGTDPVEYNLLFSRFLTMDRIACPDIDSDVSKKKRQEFLNYLDNKYGSEFVSQIGTITYLGVKNGLADVGRVLDIPYGDMQKVSKTIDEICDDPGLSFKKLDGLKEKDKAAYDKFEKLENDNKELFMYARKLEGTIRSVGIHAGGVLITPCPINKYFPTRYINGRKVTTWDKDHVERKKGVKLDYLGLNTVSMVDDTLINIEHTTGVKITTQELYDNKDIRHDEGTFKLISKKETEAVFQLESDLFKSVISEMQPDNINDIIALTSLCRPGPLSAGMHTTYNNRKNGKEEITMPLRGIEDILYDSMGTIIYQEHCMLISQKVAGFDDNHADSYLRKSLAKGDKVKMELCRRWLIYGKKNEKAPEDYNDMIVNQVMYDPEGKYGNPILGGINNGYTELELNEFWEMLKGYAEYLFNKSHATSYSLESNITAYLKTYYPIEYFSAVLTNQDNEDKLKLYMNLLPKQGMTLQVPDINKSNIEFTPDPYNKTILFGLSAVKGVKNAASEIIAHRPYVSLEDMIEKIPKKYFNKTVATNLIKAGALDNLYGGSACNRNALINKLYELRKDKDEPLIEEDYNNYVCMEYETEVLGEAITYRPWYDSLEENTSTTFDGELLSLREKIDKNGNMMAFAKVLSDNCEIELVVFARTYNNYSDAFDIITGKYITLTGKKDDKGKFLVSKAIKNKALNI